MTESLLRIGEVADATGLAVSAIRYYDEIGLVVARMHDGNGRMFSQDAVGRVLFVQRCKDAGFTLEEIGQILDDTSGGWLQLVEAKQRELVQRRDHLSKMIGVLDDVKRCGCSVVTECSRQPVVTAAGQ